MILSEAFVSIQGEGPQMGLRVLFVRLAGCNLGCGRCDSKYARYGIDVSIDALIHFISEQSSQRGVHNVVWTGGEPLLQKGDIFQVIDATKNVVKHSVETNGTIRLSRTEAVMFDYIISSPKGNPSECDELLEFSNMYLKPVIDVDDANVVGKWILFLRGLSLSKQNRVYIMPWTQNPPVPHDDIVRKHNIDIVKIIKLIDEQGLACHVAPRLQLLYGVR